jgi:hypothetical protein
MSLPQVLIVGAGVTGSLLASMVKDMGLVVHVVEKSRSAGGRMATNRFRNGDRDSAVVARADLGAQYVSTKSSAEHPVLGPVYRRLEEAGVLLPFAGEVKGPNPYGGNNEVRHFTAPSGLQSISELFLQSADVPVDWGSALEAVSVDESGKMTVSAGGATVDVATPCVLVLTQPVPQVLGASRFPVGGNFLDSVAESSLQDLKKVEYSSRFAAAYVFENFSWPFSWTVQYFSQGDVRYVSHDSGKRQAQNEPWTSVVVHGAVPMGIELVDEQEPFPSAEDRLLQDLRQKMPEVPWAEARLKKIQKWKYSQVYKGYAASRPSPDWTWDANTADSCLNGFPGCVSLFENDHSLALMCGDAFAPASKFDGCVYSAKRGAEAIKTFFQSQLASK